MENFNANDAAFTLMSDAKAGSDISRKYNSLNSNDQKDVFDAMLHLKSDNSTMKLFGNIELVDSDGNRILDDLKLNKTDGSIKDLYSKSSNDYRNQSNDLENPSQITILPSEEMGAMSKELLKDRRDGSENLEEQIKFDTASNDKEPEFQPLTRRDIQKDPTLRQADRMLRLASGGRDMMQYYQRYQNDPNMLEAMRAVQDSNPEYSNVKLIDANKDGILDDARALVNGRNGVEEVDVLKTPEDIARERIKNQSEQAVRRGGEIILDEVIRGGRGGQSAGGRIWDRMGRETTNGAHRVLRDILRGR